MLTTAYPCNRKPVTCSFIYSSFCIHKKNDLLSTEWLRFLIQIASPSSFSRFSSTLLLQNRSDGLRIPTIRIAQLVRLNCETRGAVLNLVDAHQAICQLEHMIPQADDHKLCVPAWQSQTVPQYPAKKVQARSLHLVHRAAPGLCLDIIGNDGNILEV